jgi:hypothetical protein
MFNIVLRYRMEKHFVHKELESEWERERNLDEEIWELTTATITNALICHKLSYGINSPHSIAALGFSGCTFVEFTHSNSLSLSLSHSIPTSAQRTRLMLLLCIWSISTLKLSLNVSFPFCYCSIYEIMQIWFLLCIPLCSHVSCTSCGYQLLVFLIYSFDNFCSINKWTFSERFEFQYWAEYAK